MVTRPTSPCCYPCNERNLPCRSLLPYPRPSRSIPSLGMQVEKVGGRWYCRWSAEDLRLFMLEHVLIHEVGHHVQCTQRQRQGVDPWPSRRVSEQFAEAYACR